MVGQNTWDNYLTSTEGSLRRVQLGEAEHSGKSVGQSDQVALRVNYITLCELFSTDDNICSITVLHHACHFVSNLWYNLIYFPQIYALHCPILEQCKVPPSPSKKSTKCSKGILNIIIFGLLLQKNIPFIVYVWTYFFCLAIFLKMRLRAAGRI